MKGGYLVFEAKSTLTSKGQITVPKIIRDVMNLNTGDQVKFSVESNNKVLIEKTGSEEKTIALMNLISLLLKDNSPFVIKGGIAVGKTYLAKNLLLSQFNDKNVAIIEPFNGEYNQLKDIMDTLDTFVTSQVDADTIISEINHNNYDLIVIDEVGHIDFELIKEVHQTDKKLILISQVFEPSTLLKLGSHISVTVEKTGIALEKYELVEDKFKVIPIYVD